jgi:dihydroorotate dehydrogenase (fumarate)
MVDLRCSYLGLDLDNPLVPSSSPLTGGLDSARHLEDAGAAALVMPSLFEEVIIEEQSRLDRFLDEQSLGHGEADSFRPLPVGYMSREEKYLETIAALKTALSIPVIASLNGTTSGGWIEHAEALAEAGADALELNVYYLPASPEDTAANVEARYLDVASALIKTLKIPVTMKLTSQLTAPLDLIRRLDAAGVRGVSLFNRFYQPDIDLDTLDVTPALALSTSDEALLRVRWTAMLFGHTDCDIAVTGGFHNADDVLKALLAGASAVHLCSVLLREGPAALTQILNDMSQWLDENEYESVQQMRGSVSQRNAPNPAQYARANYIDIIDNYSPPAGVRY